MSSIKLFYPFVLLSGLLIGSSSDQLLGPELPLRSENKPSERLAEDSISSEIDQIYSLLSYALVYKTWQENDRTGRGYNIAAVLVDTGQNLLTHDFNSVNQYQDATQHGEVRLITHYLNTSKTYNINGYTVYTTLEPCAMCAGMMIMTSVRRVVYGQPDVAYSKALERLSLDTKSCGGYAPYPRSVISQAAPLPYPYQLDTSYQDYTRSGNKPIITKYLSTRQAKKIYEKASEEFLNFKVKFDRNKPFYQKALVYYQSVH